MSLKKIIEVLLLSFLSCSEPQSLKTKLQTFDGKEAKLYLKNQCVLVIKEPKQYNLFGLKIDGTKIKTFYFNKAGEIEQENVQEFFVGSSYDANNIPEKDAEEAKRFLKLRLFPDYF